MRDIAIAFAASTLAALVLGFLVDTAAASTAFGVVFPAVIAVLERREREKERRREAELRQELKSPSEPPPPKSREDATPLRERPGREASYPSAQEELRTLQQRATIPAIDWRRVAIGTIASVILVGLTVTILSPIAAILALFVFESAFVIIVPMIIAASIMLATGFWVGRRSVGGGFLGATVMGSIVGVSVPLILLFFGGLDQDLANIAWALVVFTSAGVLMASIGGLLGVRRRYRASAYE